MLRKLPRVLAVVLVPLLLVASCGYAPMQRHLRQPTEVSRITEDQVRGGFLKAHLRDGSVALFNSWRVEDSERKISGEGWRFEASRDRGVEGPIVVPLDSVVVFESNLAPERLHPAIQALLVVVGVAALAAVTAVAAVAIFGSCPTFYVWNGESYVLAAEGFSSSVTPFLEATDLDALPQAKPRGRELEVVMLNEMLETHVVRSVRLVAAPRQGAARVLVDPQGVFHRADRLIPPSRALAPEGDCTQLLRARDGAERFARTDSTDLAALETVELEFEPPLRGTAGLFIASRQSLVTTYLLYKTLAWMGRSAPTWIAQLETAPQPVRERTRELGNDLGGIEVEIHDGSRWIPAGEVGEIGPIAVDERVLPLPRLAHGIGRVRLTMARGSWRLDQVALATLSGTVVPLRLDPIRVQRTASGLKGGAPGAR